MELSAQAEKVLARIAEDGSLDKSEFDADVLDELSAAGMVLPEEHDTYTLIVLTEDGELTAAGGDSPSSG